MKHKKSFAVIVVVLFAMTAWFELGFAVTKDDLIAGAKKEGSINFYGPTTLEPRWVKETEVAFNKKYGLDIKVNFSPSANMNADVVKVITWEASGATPAWDLMMLSDAHQAILWKKNLLEKFDNTALDLDPNLIKFEGKAVAGVSMIALPAYNKKVLQAKDLPKSWDDLLDPKWKGGKLGMHTAVHHLARLAVGPWGEEKTTAYVKALAEQEPVLGRLGATYNRLMMGEIQIAVTMLQSFINRNKRKGAPVAFVEGIEPIVSPQFYAGIPKGAARPNVANLFAAFLTTLEAQQIWEQYGGGQTSAFVPGTATYKYLQGKQVLYMGEDQVADVERLSAEYSEILGFRKRK